MSSRNLPCQKIRVLIVEPSSYLRAGLKIVLSEDTEIECLPEATDGRSAISIAQVSVPNVILSATKLPDMSGIELVTRIKAQFPHLKAILLSSESDPAEAVTAVISGVSGYSSKYVSDSRLREIIKAVHDGAVWFDAPSSSTAFGWMAASLKHAAGRYPEQLQLTEREKEVLSLISLGHTNDEIAQSLSISVHTAKVHVSNVLDKLNVKDRVQAAVKATRACLK